VITLAREYFARHRTLQHWHIDGSISAADVRRLLRTLRNPQVAAVDPLARALCDALHAATPLLAVKHLLMLTFAQHGAAGEKLAEVIRQSDLEGSLSQAGVARELGYSLRQYFRYRSQAIEMLTKHVRQLVQHAGSAPYPIETLALAAHHANPSIARGLYDLLGRKHSERHFIGQLTATLDSGRAIDERAIQNCPRALRPHAQALLARSLLLHGHTQQANDIAAALEAEASPSAPQPEVAAELALIAALQARGRYDASAMMGAVERTKNLDLDPHVRVHLMILEAEAYLRMGMSAQALEVITLAHRMAADAKSLRGLARTTLLYAQCALLADDLAGAEELASAACLALQDHPRDLALAQLTLASIQLWFGKPWTATAPCDACDGSSWEHLATDAIKSRYLLRDAKIDEASELAERILRTAAEKRYTGLIAHAAASLGACFGIRQDDEQERRFYATAWAQFVQTRDVLLGNDLFSLPSMRPKALGPLELDDDFLSSVQRLLSAPIGVPKELCLHAITYANGDSFDQAGIQRLTHAVTRYVRHDTIVATGKLIAVLLPRERRAKWAERWLEAFEQV